MTARMLRFTITALVFITAAALMCSLASAEAYCYITDVKWEAMSNAVQIEVKSDGVLKWQWTSGEDESGQKRRLVSVSFPNARLKLEDRYVDVDAAPLSTIVLYTPQNAQDGTGIVMEVQLSEASGFKGVGSTDGRSFVLTVDAPLRAEGGDAKAGGKGAAKSDGEELAVEVDGGLVTIRALRADIHKVVAEVARQAGLNITLDKAVAHKVNINLSGVKPLEVIRYIAAGYGLALSTKDDVLMLSEGVPKDLTTYNRSGTASFPMQFLQAEEAKELLPTFLTKYVHFNAEQNAVVATAPNQMLEKIERDLKSVDLPPPLIMVEVVAVELASTGNYERDLSWLYSTHDKTFGADNGTGDLNYHGTGWGGLTGGVISNTSNLTVNLQALQSAGKAKIKANPRIAAVNGKSASIFIGQDRFILVQYASGGTMQQRVEAVPVGVRLEVRPWTGGNGEITTRVDADVSNISEVDPATGLPLLSSRKASSTVRTRDGETIVIGGLRQRQNEVTNRKVPILGDLPLLGGMFRSKSTASVDTELVIFVTPRVLSVDGGTLDEAQRDQRERMLEEGDPGYIAPEPGPAVAPQVQ